MLQIFTFRLFLFCRSGKSFMLVQPNLRNLIRLSTLSTLVRFPKAVTSLCSRRIRRIRSKFRCPMSSESQSSCSPVHTGLLLLVSCLGARTQLLVSTEIYLYTVSYPFLCGWCAPEMCIFICTLRRTIRFISFA